MTAIKQQGVTLLEILLVLTIASMLILMGLRQYRVYVLDRDVAQTKFNVNLLFDGLKKYYQRHCRGLYDAARDTYDGKLYEARKSGSRVDVDIKTELVDSGFLPSSAWPLTQTSLVNNADEKKPGYVAQFNYGTLSRRYACWDGQCISLDKTVLVWRPQVAIRLPATVTKETAEFYRKMLGADCISMVQGNFVVPCEDNPSALKDFYLVWERLPSFATEESTSSLWSSTPRLQQFNQQYTNDTLYQLNNPQDPDRDNYYLCGG